nr:methyltransferase domain-containing protein [Evansella caseinilytica]
MDYFATVLPGLEDILIEEIQEKLYATKVIKRTRGKVFIRTALNIEQLKELKIADNLYLLISKLDIGLHRSHLDQLRDQMFHLNLKPFLKKGTSYHVNTSRKGNHNYSRFEAAKTAMDGIKQRYPHTKKSINRRPDVNFRLDIDEQEGLFSLKRTNASYRFRRTDRHFSAAALLPTVAHAMVWLSHPDEEDVFIDPCCGSGTVLSERLSYPFTYIGGGDINRQALEVANENLMDTLVEIIHWDARQLDFANSSIDKVVTNLPFGRQITQEEEIDLINREIINEIARVLKEHGKAVILSEGWDEIVKVAQSSHLQILKSYPLSLKGLHPTIYVFEKLKI